MGATKLQLCAAGLILLCWSGCGRTVQFNPGISGSDVDAGSVRDDAAPPDAAPPDGAPHPPKDAGTVHPRDAEPNASEDDAGTAEPPPMPADAAVDSDPLGGDPEPSGPRIAIDFPPKDARTDRSELHVRGRLVEAKGGTLTLDGASVPVDEAGAWSTRVQLAPGKNALRFELALGNERFQATRNIRSEPTLYEPYAVAIDSTLNRGYVADRDTLQSFDLDTGERRLISGPARGQGPQLTSPTTMILDSANQRAFIGAHGPVLFMVDLESGDRRVSTLTGTDLMQGVLSLSLAADGRVFVTGDTLAWFNPSTGVATPLTPKPAIELSDDPTWPARIRQVVWKEGPEQAYLAVDATISDFALYSTNLTTGASTLVSSATRGAGPVPIIVSSMLIHPSADVAYISGHLDGYEEVILSVDLQSGDRTIVTHQSRGKGPNFVSQLAYDAARGRLIAPFRDGVLAVAFESGDRTVISSNQVGEGFDLELTHALSLSPDGQHVVAIHPSRTVEPSLLAIDLRSGKQRVVVEHLPAGEDFVIDSSDAPPRAVWVVDRFRDAIWTVNLQDGARDRISALGIGEGPVFQDPQRVAYDPVADPKHAYVLDSRNSGQVGVAIPTAIVRVAPSNGNRTIISDETTGTGPNGTFVRIALDAKRKRVIVLTADVDGLHFLAIDLQTGQRSRVGNSFALEDVSLSEVTLDAAGNQMLVASVDVGLISIDLDSGEQKQVSGPGLGQGIGRILGLTTDPVRRLAIALCDGDVVVVDLSTGERVIVS